MGGRAAKTRDLARERWEEKFIAKKIRLIGFAIGSTTHRIDQLRALSLRQPWAWLVVTGYKDIENRSWRTNHRGPLLIHASQNRLLTTPESLAAIEKKYDVDLPQEFDFGGIVGAVEVIDCVKTHPSKWKFADRWGWVLRNGRTLPFQKCKGAVGFFRVRISN